MSASLVVAVRDWPLDRLAGCLTSFCAAAPAALSELIVVDFGSQASVGLDGLPVDSRIRIVRVEAKLWSLAEATNLGVLAASSPVIVKTDADLVLAPASVPAFEAVIAAVEQGTPALSLTQVLDLPFDPVVPPDIPALCASILADDRPAAALRPRWGEGGLTIFRRAVWDEIGGYESRFSGWGNEDNDFSGRVRAAGHRLRWTPRGLLQLYHLPHAPSYELPDVVARRRQNIALAETDRSVRRRMRVNTAAVAAPAVVARPTPHVTLAIATSHRPNRDRMLVEAALAFRSQIDNDFEFVIVDNGSAPETAAATKQHFLQAVTFAEARFEYLAAPSIPVARNTATRLARGRYICVVDDDDIALPNRLADHLACFETDRRTHASHGGWIDFDEQTGQIERNGGKPRTIDQLLFGTGKITAHPASLYRTDVLRAVPYDESFLLGSDLDLAIRAARLELNCAHTGSYVTLRRFHANNVTLAGTPEQSAGGQRARQRALAGYTADLRTEMSSRARGDTSELACRNELSLEEIADHLPAYVGAWHLVVPASVFGMHGAAEEQGAEQRAAAGSELLEKLHRIVEGDFVTLANGAAMPIFWRSDPIEGVRNARHLRFKAEGVLDTEVRLISVKQLVVDREEGFPWARLGDAERRLFLRSGRFESLADALFACRDLEQGSLLAAMVSVVSDRDGAGDCYYLMTEAIADRTQATQLQGTLQRKTGAAFHPIGVGGVVGNALPVQDRRH
jgi:GT2 family glycosyltransferase